MLPVMPIRNLLAALVLAASAAHAAPAGHEPDRYAAARDYIRSQLVANSVPSVTVAVFRDGRIDWEEGFGWADREGSVEATPFVPSAALTGKWVGHIAIPEGNLPVTLDLRADGFMSMVVGHELPALLNAAEFKDGEFSAQVATSLKTKDTERFKYTMRLALKAEGDRLYGAAAAVSDLTDQRFTAGLTYWIDLSREQHQPQP
jgi:hypothetical protein